MTDDPSESALRKARERLAVAVMEAQRPLDALLPALREPELPQAAVHPRVLEVVGESGIEWLLLVWADPGGPQALHREVQALVEATLLAELSRTPAVIHRQGARKFAGLRLVSFADIEWDVYPAVRAFGFRPDERPLADDVRAAIDGEAGRAQRTAGAPTGSWSATIRHPSGALGERLDEIDRMMADKLGEATWGESPGEFSHLFASYARKVFGEPLRPTLEGLATLDLLVVQQEEDVIRWIPPLVFQAVCDLLPVVAASKFGARISWAQSEDLGDGFAHPPLLRVEDGGQGIHIPIGHHVLRWWMMPLFPGDVVPSPADWLTDQFGPDGAAGS